MLVRIDKVGQVGIVRDTKPWEMPYNAWSDGQNVRMQDGAVVKMTGYSALTTPSIAPYFVLPVWDKEIPWIFHAGLSQINVFNAGTITDVSKSGGYSMSESIGWNGGVLNGVVILNNGVDNPQFFSYPPALTNDFANLTNWPASTTARVVKPFKNYLVALDVTESGTRYPWLVRWSHPAEPGTVPSSWNYSDATKDAGRTPLSESGGACVDFLPLGDLGVIYREQSTWGMQYIGPPYIFRFYEIFKNSGILARHCACEFKGQHFVVTNEDIVVHGGGGAQQSVVEDKVKRYVFNDIDATYYINSFAVPNFAQSEVWFCYPETGSSRASKALVWNWKDNSIGFRDLPNVNHAAFGIIGLGSSFTPSALRVIAGHAGPKLSIFDSTNQDNGGNMTAYVERQGITIPNTDTQTVKFLRRVYPRITGTATTMTVSVAGTMNPNETPSYTDYTFTVGTDEKVDCRVSGRFLHVKFASAGNQEWQLDGYDLDVELAGEN
jgi:hypothetical protein